MCGLYGVLDTMGRGLGVDDLDIIEEMGILTQLRGRHSSGLFVVDGKSVNRKPAIVKTLGPSVNLEWEEKDYPRAAELIKTTAMAAIGHGRYATVGKITKGNAHPFYHDGITLVHNGTIRSGLETEMTNTEVDSHALTKKIAAEGVVKALHGISGAYAIILHNQKDGKMYISRNWERSLYYMQTRDRIYIMSDEGALNYLNVRRQLWFNKYEEPRQFLPDHVYSFDGDKLVDEDVIVKTTSWGGYYRNNYGNYQLAPVTNTPPPAPAPAPTTLSGTSLGKTLPINPAYRKGENVEFVVRSYFFEDKEQGYIFECADIDNNKIFFKTSKPDPTLVGKSGYAPVVAMHFSIVNLETKWSYQVKTRNIIWDHKKEKEEMVETLDCMIPKKVWEEICKNNTCSCCRSALDPEHADSTLVEVTGAGWEVVCPSCVDTVLTSNSQATVDDVRNYLQ